MHVSFFKCAPEVWLRRPIHPACMNVLIDLVFTVFFFLAVAASAYRTKHGVFCVYTLRFPDVIVNIAAFADLSHKAWGAHVDRTSKESPCTKASKYHLHSICYGWRVGIVYTHPHGDRPRGRHSDLTLPYLTLN